MRARVLWKVEIINWLKASQVSVCGWEKNDRT